jgi:hypothetical protein
LAGELVKENDLNVHIRDNMLVLKTPLTDAGKLISLSSTYVDNLSGANLTGVIKSAQANDYTAGIQNFNAGATTRFVAPIGSDLWGT